MNLLVLIQSTRRRLPTTIFDYVTNNGYDIVTVIDPLSQHSPYLDYIHPPSSNDKRARSPFSLILYAIVFYSFFFHLIFSHAFEIK